jgi:hypothetical protein
VPVKSVDQQLLQQSHRLREQYKITRNARINLLRAAPRELGILTPVGLQPAIQALRTAMHTSPSGLPEVRTEVCARVLQEVEQLQQGMADLERTLRDLTRKDPVVRDLMTIPGVGLLIATALRATLKAPKYSRRPDLLQRIDILLAEAPMLEETDLVLILTYLDKGPRAVSNTLLRETLQRLVPEQTERIMGWLTQPYFDKGKAEGRAEGRLEGRAEGEAKVLVRLIEKRFGVVSPQLRERILAADVATVEE